MPEAIGVGADAGRQRGTGGRERDEREGEDGAAAGGRSSSSSSSTRPMQLLAAARAYFSHPNEDLRTVRMTWWGGFCGLPLLWLLNWINFRKATQEADALTELKILVRLSLGLFVLALAIFATWLVYFQTVTETLVCPCDGPFGSDFRSRAAAFFLFYILAFAERACVWRACVRACVRACMRA